MKVVLRLSAGVSLIVLAQAMAVDPAQAQAAPPAQQADLIMPTAVPDTASKSTPAPSEVPRLGVGGARDFMRAVSADLDAKYDDYLSFKKMLSDKYNLDYSLDFTFYPQWGTSGKSVAFASYYPSVTWRPFTNTAIGSGEITATVAQQAYFTKTDTGAQAAQLGLITFANDWVRDNFTWSKLAYTHTLPGAMNWLSITGGQYNLFAFDPNSYAGNAQTTFISYSFAQDATQTFPNAGLGAYVEAKGPRGLLAIAGGVQGATDLNGGTLTTDGFEKGKLVSWGNIQFTPTIANLGAGVYSLLVYDQPMVPRISGHTTGISFSASQEIGTKWGAFMRINNVTGQDIPIRTSYAFGGVSNDPIARNPGDQAGLAFGWDKTNKHFTGPSARDNEWVTELYYKATIFKGLNLTPDVQVFWNPALHPNSGAEAVFTLRTTAFF